MLKIKDSVDLKKLEKFGFDYDEYTKCYDNIECDMWINTERKIENLVFKEMLDLDAYQEMLYDLIKADMVAKVEE